MYVEIDLSRVPPAVELREPDDFTGFKVVVKRLDNTHVDVSSLRDLAGRRADDPGWQGQLASMLEYASAKGWIGADGSIDAHVEWIG